MGFRFRHTFTLFPGVRFNLSGSGMSVSLGVPGATINLKPGRAPMATLGIPGTGVSFRTTLELDRNVGGPHNGPGRRLDPPRIPQTPLRPGVLTEKGAYAHRDITSRPVEELTSSSLAAVKDMMIQARAERADLEREISNLAAEAAKASARADKWEFPLWHWMVKNKAKNVRAEADRLKNDLVEARAAFEQHGVSIHWEMDSESDRVYRDLLSAFEAASRSVKIWDIIEEQQIDRAIARSTASRSITRKPVAFKTGRPSELPLGDDDPFPKVPLLANANGGDLYIFPGFLLVHGDHDFALLHPSSLRIAASATRFVEEETVPPDARTVGETWRYTNKDGGPDRRFSGNYPKP